MSLSVEAHWKDDMLDKLVSMTGAARDKVLLDAAKDARDEIKSQYRSTYKTHSKKKGGLLVQMVKAKRRPKFRGGGAKVTVIYYARWLEYGAPNRMTKDRSSIPEKGKGRAKRKTGRTAHSTGTLHALPIIYPACARAFGKALGNLRDAVAVAWRNQTMADG